MTNEKRAHAIEWIARELGFLRSAPALNGCEMKKEWAEQIEVFEAALEALNDHVREDTKMMDHFPDAAKMVPLTMEQLLRMRNNEGIQIGDGNGNIEERGIIDAIDRFSIGKSGTIYAFENYGKTWLAYANNQTAEEE